MRLGRNVDKLENNYWKETEEKLRKKYGTKDSLYLIEEVADFEDLKKRIGYGYPGTEGVGGDHRKQPSFYD